MKELIAQLHDQNRALLTHIKPSAATSQGPSQPATPKTETLHPRRRRYRDRKLMQDMQAVARGIALVPKTA